MSSPVAHSPANRAAEASTAAQGAGRAGVKTSTAIATGVVALLLGVVLAVLAVKLILPKTIIEVHERAMVKERFMSPRRPTNYDAPYPMIYPDKPFKPPQRKSLEDTTPAERKQYIDAVLKMAKVPHKWANDTTISPRYQNLTWYGLLVTIHGTNYPQNSFAHMGVHFPSWHRLFMWLFEYGLNHVSDFPVPPITVPYWDWTSSAATQELYDWLGGDGDPFDDSCVPRGPFAWPKWNISVLPDQWVIHKPQACLKRGISTDGIATTDIQEASHMPTSSNVFDSLLAMRFASFPWDESQLGSLSFHNAIEGYSDLNNEGDNNQLNQHAFHGMHNIVHLTVGGDMKTLVSPNDPMFFNHHGNIDRVLQTWLVTAGKVYGTGTPRTEGNTQLTRGYPAQIRKVKTDGTDDDPEYDCSDIKVRIADQAVGQKLDGLMVKFGDGSPEAWKLFLKCAYINDASGAQIVGDTAYGKRILLGFPKGSDNAAYVPPIPELFTDPFIFEATVNTSKVNTAEIVYEEFVLGTHITVDNETWYLAGPTFFNKILDMALYQPSWLAKAKDVLLPNTDRINQSKFTLHSSFDGSDNADHAGEQFLAIAVSHEYKQKYKGVNGRSPANYDATGYFEAVKNKPLVLRFDGTDWEPTSPCTNIMFPDNGCKSTSYNGTNIQPSNDQMPTMNGIFGVPSDKVSYVYPDSTDFAFVELTNWNCMSWEQLQHFKLLNVDNENDPDPEMEPKKAEYCVVQGYFVFKDAADRSHNQEIVAKFANASASQSKSPSLSIAPLPERLNQKGEPRGFAQNMDVSDNIYVGARPGGNAQDLLIPFNQLNLNFSPAFFQDEKTANYKDLYMTPQ